IWFENADAIPHNVQYTTIGHETDREFNVLLAPNARQAAPQPLPVVRGPDTFRCNIHQWMNGYAWSLNHRYAAVTDDEGNFVIPEAPVGTWRLVVWHERVGYRGWRDPRLGELVRLTDRPDGLVTLDPLEFESDTWNEKPER